MKKKYLRLLLTVAIAAALVFAMAAPAYADDGGIVFTTPLPGTMTYTKGSQFELSVAAAYTIASADAPAITYTWQSSSGTATGATIRATAMSDDVITCTAAGVVNGTYVTTTTSCIIKVVDATPAPTATPTPTTAPSGVSTPTILTQPSSVRLVSGQTATLSVTATCPNLGNGVSLVYQWFYSKNSNGSNAVAINNSNSSTFTTPLVNTTYYYFVGIIATNGTQNSSPVYSNIVSVTYNGGQLKVTKNPTGETVDAGGSATFIARADNAAKHVWRIVSKDTTQTINAKDAPSYFRGLSVSGVDGDTLVLSNIPASMNEWSVECKFIAADGKTFVCSNGAVIRVRGASSNTGSSTSTPSTTAKPSTTYVPGASASPSATTRPNTGDSSSSVSAPTISSQPVGAVLNEGETTTLSVVASAASQGENVELRYQWYRNDTNSNANGTAIGGAQSASYKPDTISGTKYYYVGVWSTDGTHTSKVIYSSPVAVTYAAPTATPSPEPTDNAGGVGSAIIGPVIAMVLAAAAIGVGVFFLLKNLSSKGKSGNGKNYDEYNDGYDRREYDDGYDKNYGRGDRNSSDNRGKDDYDR